MYPPPDDWLPGRRGHADSGPIFTDPSGQRRRLLRIVGVAGSMFLVSALVLVGLGLFGGPNTPLSVFGPRPHPSHSGAAGRDGKGEPGRDRPGSSANRTPSARRSSHSRTASATPTASSSKPSPTPTNKGGKTPRGHTRSPDPHPHPSPSSTHAR